MGCKKSFIDHYEHGLGYFKFNEALNMVQLAQLIPTKEIEEYVEEFDYRFRVTDCNALTQRLKSTTRSRTCVVDLELGLYYVAINCSEYRLIPLILNTLLGWGFRCTLYSKYQSHLPITFQPEYHFSLTELEEMFALAIETNIDEYAKLYGYEYNYSALYKRLLQYDESGYSPLLNLNNWKTRGNPPFSIKTSPRENLGQTPCPTFVSRDPSYPSPICEL